MQHFHEQLNNGATCCFVPTQRSQQSLERPRCAAFRHAQNHCKHLDQHQPATRTFAFAVVGEADGQWIHSCNCRLANSAELHAIVCCSSTLSPATRQKPASSISISHPAKQSWLHIVKHILNAETLAQSSGLLLD